MADANKSGDLMSSGKLVADAAVSVFQKHSVEDIDKGKVAGASSDLLHAASEYGHLEDKTVGQYIEKAEGYLSQFSSPPAATAEAGKEKEDVEGGAAAPADALKLEAEENKDKKPPPAAQEEKPAEGFGFADVMKGAEGLHQKQGGGGGEESTGAGGLFKMAQGFLK